MCCKVSIILPVYNGGTYICETLNSLQNQTYRDFEVIIIDDCSTDCTASIIQAYPDTRIRYHKNTENRGIVYSLNRAISLAKGVYIARMDSDDICLPDRLEKQVTFLEQHPDIGLISTWFETFGEQEGTIRYETDPERIKCKLLFSIQLLHPGWMFRRRLIENYGLSYREEYKYAEDWDFLVRAASVTKLSNVPQTLMRYRISPGQISNVQNKAQRQVADCVAQNQLFALGLLLSDDDFRLYRNSFGRREIMLSVPEMETLIGILEKMEEANQKSQYYDTGTLRSVIQEELFHLAYYNLIHRRRSGLLFLRSKFYHGLSIGFVKCLKLLLRSFFVIICKSY